MVQRNALGIGTPRASGHGIAKRPHRQKSKAALGGAIGCEVVSENLKIGSTCSLPRFPGASSLWPGRYKLPYQVKAGSLTIITATSVDALELFDELARTVRDEVLIRDMDGRTVDPDTLRSAIADE